MISHGAVLRKNFFEPQQLLAIVHDYHHANLPEEEVALMDFAQKVVTQPKDICSSDIDQLHNFGLSDEEILDVVMVATARSFFSKTLDALGAEPDQAYQQMEPELLQALAIGRPFPQAEANTVPC